VPALADLLELADRAALRGGALVAREGPGPLVEAKGVGDYVTEVDRASERAIREVLGEGTPDIPVVGEEAGGVGGRRSWVVDPLDGTTNYVHGFPVVGVSVALVEDGTPIVGVVHAPFLEQTFLGAKGLGARVRTGRREAVARVSGRQVEQAVVGTGFPFRRKGLLPRYIAAFEACLERFEDLRRPGAAALDLAWVAAGVFDGFFELGLGTWDVAAGALLIREAGGTVTDWEGGERYLESGDILAGPPPIHAALLEIARNG
jgi:myo-inositol-1(or 4)-monophosphatase